MRRWQWALLSGVALLAATWANGMGSLCWMGVAAVLGMAGGWIMAAKVIP